MPPVASGKPWHEEVSGTILLHVFLDALRDSASQKEDVQEFTQGKAGCNNNRPSRQSEFELFRGGLLLYRASLLRCKSLRLHGWWNGTVEMLVTTPCSWWSRCTALYGPHWCWSVFDPQAQLRLYGPPAHCQTPSPCQPYQSFRQAHSSFDGVTSWKISDCVASEWSERWEFTTVDSW